MSHLHYLGVLLFIALCAVGIWIGFKIRIQDFWRIFLATDLSILLVYLAWDIWAIVKGNWYFDKNQILNIFPIPYVPLEEVLFFIVVPITTLMTYKALTKITGWKGSGE